MPLPRKTEHKMLNEFVPKVTLLRPLDPEGKTSMKLKTVQMLFEMIEIQKKMYVYTTGNMRQLVIDRRICCCSQFMIFKHEFTR